MYQAKKDALRLAVIWMLLAGVMSATAWWTWMKIPPKTEIVKEIR